RCSQRHRTIDRDVDADAGGFPGGGGRHPELAGPPRESARWGGARISGSRPSEDWGGGSQPGGSWREAIVGGGNLEERRDAWSETIAVDDTDVPVSDAPVGSNEVAGRRDEGGALGRGDAQADE